MVAGQSVNSTGESYQLPGRTMDSGPIKQKRRARSLLDFTPLDPATMELATNVPGYEKNHMAVAGRKASGGGRKGEFPCGHTTNSSYSTLALEGGETGYFITSDTVATPLH